MLLNMLKQYKIHMNELNILYNNNNGYIKLEYSKYNKYKNVDELEKDIIKEIEEENKKKEEQEKNKNKNKNNERKLGIMDDIEEEEESKNDLVVYPEEIETNIFNIRDILLNIIFFDFDKFSKNKKQLLELEEKGKNIYLKARKQYEKQKNKLSFHDEQFNAMVEETDKNEYNKLTKQLKENKILYKNLITNKLNRAHQIDIKDIDKHVNYLKFLQWDEKFGQIKLTQKTNNSKYNFRKDFNSIKNNCINILLEGFNIFYKTQKDKLKFFS